MGTLPAQPAQPAQAVNKLPANLHKHWDSLLTQLGPVSGPDTSPAAAQGGPALQNNHLEVLPQALIDWLQNPRTQGGDELPTPSDLLPMFDDLVVKADALIRERDPRWRIWRGNKCLRLKAWVWDPEPPPYQRPRKQSKRYP